MFLRQFFDPASSTFSYIIACHTTKYACIIDPVLEHTKLYMQLLNQWQFKLKYALETHTHADHITAASQLKNLSGCKLLIAQQSQAQGADERFNDNDEIAVGKLHLTAHYTPGHTDDSYCFTCGNCVFTGDTLLIRGTGRTDFQSGCALQAYHSIHNKLFTLPDSTQIYPGHDYKTLNTSTIYEEKQFNPRLQVNDAQAYADIMNNLKLSKPKKIDVALPANLTCGKLINQEETQHVK